MNAVVPYGSQEQHILTKRNHEAHERRSLSLPISVLLKTRTSCLWLRMNAARYFIKLSEVLLEQMTAFIMSNSVLLET